RKVMDLLAADPLWPELAPLLSAVLPVSFPETPRTAHLSGEVRADVLHEVLIALLRRTAPRRPLLLVLADAHWFDSASWALAVLVARRVPALLLVVSSRPAGDQAPREQVQLLRTPHAERLVLDALDGDEVSALAAHSLGADRLPEAADRLIRDRAQGNPFFGEELAYAMREAGLLVVEGRTCRLRDGGDLRTVPFPDSVQGVVASRVDRLEPSLQLTLKVASVIGRVFAFRTLHDVYPLTAERDRLPDNLTTLGR